MNTQCGLAIDYKTSLEASLSDYLKGSVNLGKLILASGVAASSIFTFGCEKHEEVKISEDQKEVQKTEGKKRTSNK